MTSVKWRGFASTTRLEEATRIFMEKARFEPEPEVIPVEEAHRRKLVEDVSSPLDLPGFRRSAMDGYAVVASDTHGASDTSPKTLRLVGSSDIGETIVKSISEGECMKILTGAPVPEGADAVVKVEDTDQLEEGFIEVYSPVVSGRNVAEKDEDVKQGTLIFKAGRILSLMDISLLISMGITEVNVYRRPRVAVVSTGNELVPASQKLGIGQVYDSNRPAIALWAKCLGAKVVTSTSCEDDPDTIMDTLARIIPHTDFIITTGGTSVGTKDYMEEVVSVMGEIWVHGISIRPGKPVILGKIREGNSEVPILALPGYPLAAFLNFENFGQEILARWTGFRNPRSYTDVILNQTIPSNPGIRDFVRLKKCGESEDGTPIVDLIRITGAGILSSLVLADYLLEVPEDVEGYPKGSTVKVRVLDYTRL